MPIIKSAKKALRSSLRKRVYNVRAQDTMRGAVKQITKAITAHNKGEAVKLLPAVQQALDKAAKRGVIKTNTAARKKSRIAQAIAKLG